MTYVDVINVVGRRGGKTLQAVDWVRSIPGAVIVCTSQEHAQDLMTIYGLADDQVRVA
jgi:hypothetical protein